ncbi:MAG: spermidine/putrescine transport system ATP-binding protein [Paracoccaceae bacterium]|jgi:spermidine/putrescine transport system ATP-binding protein
MKMSNPMSQQNIIEVKGVEMRFGSFVAVRDLNLNLKQGEFFSLLGPSGCGKTTALRIIAGFLDQKKGDIHIDGQSMHDMPANKRPTNMVFQSYAIFPHLNVGDNVGFGLRKTGISRQEASARVSEALEMVELTGMERRKSSELSGGQRQRVALARALVMRPKVLLLDEPLSALDKNLRQAMQFELRRLQQKLGITFVMVTHDQYEAMTMSDRIGVMFDGEIRQIDTPEVLYAQPCNREVASFIGGMNFLNAQVVSKTETSLRVEVQSFGSLDIGVNPNVKEHDRDLLVGVRPEQLEIAVEKPQDYDAYAQGTVGDVAFYGESVHYYVRLDGVDDPIAVSVPNYFHTVDYQRGDAVWLAVQGASIIDLGKREP